MTIKLEDKWIWDSWFAHDGDKWHAYFLQADKSLGDPFLRHFNVSVGHATSNDLSNWQHLGTTFAPSTSPAWDDKTTWTGCVVQDEKGLWHLFYTGTSKSEDAMYQRIGHATSSDLHNWERVGDGLCLDLVGDNSEHYETEHMVGHWHDRAMRDPWVMKDPDDDGWLMYFTARGSNIAEPNEGGAIGFATSNDLYNWKLEKPTFVGGFGQLEVPQVFEVKGQWYCLFCNSSEHWSKAYVDSVSTIYEAGNHYLTADSVRGPWKIAQGEFLDGATPSYRYAARILNDDGQLKVIGFNNGGDNENFVGEVLDPVNVNIEDDGRLSLQKGE